MKVRRLQLVALFLVFSGCAGRKALGVDEFQEARKAILGLGGCFLVDYSYAETKALKAGYTLDSRVYDVNRDKSVKELVVPVEISDKKIRLQHILFFSDLAGNLSKGSLMKHQAEDWEFEARHEYEFIGPSHWKPRTPTAPKGAWTRRITNLDDGLRYQCSAPWKIGAGYPEWSCENYAPIPGRETRDMGRKDYNTLQRTTRILNYGGSWLERQDNVKTIDASGVKTPLAKELGKNWFVRLPTKECAEASLWADARKPYWDFLRETWEEVLDGGKDFVEQVPTGAPPRYVKMGEIEDAYFTKIEKDAGVRAKARQEMLDVISAYRK